MSFGCISGEFLVFLPWRRGWQFWHPVFAIFPENSNFDPCFCHYAFQSSQMAFFDPIFAIFSKNSNFDLCILPFAVKSAVYLFRTIPVPFAVNQNHLPRGCTPECAGMRVGVEGAAKSLHLPRLHALQVTPAGGSVEGDYSYGFSKLFGKKLDCRSSLRFYGVVYGYILRS